MPESRNSVEDIWGDRTPFRGQGKWPQRVDYRFTEEPERWVQSACVLCSNGCGIDIGVKKERIVGVRGRAIDEVNRGRLGPKGLIVRRTRDVRERYTASAIGFYTTGQLFLEEYYTLGVIGKAGLGATHGRQHAFVHSDLIGCPQGDLWMRWAAGLLFRYRRDRLHRTRGS
jgi:ferredoxin-nitrate reductase